MTPKKKISKTKVKNWLKKQGHNQNEIDSADLGTSEKIHLFLFVMHGIKHG